MSRSCSSRFWDKDRLVSSIFFSSFFSFKYSFLFARMSSLLALVPLMLKIVLNDFVRIYRMVSLFRTVSRSSFFEVLASSESDFDSSVMPKYESLSSHVSRLFAFIKGESNRLLICLNILCLFSFSFLLPSESNWFLSCPITFCC